MAWTYSDYITLDRGAARTTRFRLHIQEVSDKIDKEKSGFGRSFSSTSVQEYLETLLDKQAEEERLNQTGSDRSGFTMLLAVKTLTPIAAASVRPNTTYKMVSMVLADRYISEVWYSRKNPQFLLVSGR